MAAAPVAGVAPRPPRTAAELEEENRQLLEGLEAAEKAKEDAEDRLEEAEAQNWHIRRARQRTAARERAGARETRKIRERRELRRARGLSVTPSPTQEEIDERENARGQLSHRLRQQTRRTAVEILIASGGLHSWRQKSITGDNAKILPTAYDWSFHPNARHLKVNAIDALITAIVGERNPFLLEDMIEYIEYGRRKIKRAAKRAAKGEPPLAAPPSASPGPSAMVARAAGTPGGAQPVPVGSPPDRPKSQDTAVSSLNDAGTWAMEIGAFVDPGSDPMVYTRDLASEHPAALAEEVARIIATSAQRSSTPADKQGRDVVRHEYVEDQNDGFDLDDEGDYCMGLMDLDDALATQWLKEWVREANEEVIDEAILRLPQDINISGADFDRFANQVSEMVWEDLFLSKYIRDYTLTKSAAAKPTFDSKPFQNEFGPDFDHTVVAAVSSSNETNEPSSRAVTNAIVTIMKQTLDMCHDENPFKVADESTLTKTLGPHWKLRFRKLFADQVTPDSRTTCLVSGMTDLSLKPTPGTERFNQNKPPGGKNFGLAKNYNGPHGDTLPFDVVPNILPRKNYEPPLPSTLGQRKLMYPELFPSAIAHQGFDRMNYIEPMEEASQGDMLRIAEKNERLWAWDRAKYYEDKYTTLDELLDSQKHNVYDDLWGQPYSRLGLEDMKWPPLDNVEPLGITPRFNELISQFPLDKSIQSWELPTEPCADFDQRDDAYKGVPIPVPKLLEPRYHKPLVRLPGLPPLSRNPIRFPDNVPDIIPDENMPGSHERARLFDLVKQSAKSAEAATLQSAKVRSLLPTAPAAQRQDAKEELQSRVDEAVSDEAAALEAWDRICENAERWDREAQLKQRAARKNTEAKKMQRKRAVELQALLDKGVDPSTLRPKGPCGKWQELAHRMDLDEDEETKKASREWIVKLIKAAKKAGGDKMGVIYPKEPELEDELEVEDDAYPMEETNNQPEDEDHQMGDPPVLHPEQTLMPTPVTAPPTNPTQSSAVPTIPLPVTRSLLSPNPTAHVDPKEGDERRARLAEKMQGFATGTIPGLEPVATPADTQGKEQQNQVPPTPTDKSKDNAPVKKIPAQTQPSYVGGGTLFSLKRPYVDPATRRQRFLDSFLTPGAGATTGGEQQQEKESDETELSAGSQPQNGESKPFGYFGGSLGFGSLGGFRSPMNIPRTPHAASPNTPAKPTGLKSTQSGAKTPAKAVASRSVRFLLEPDEAAAAAAPALWSPSLDPDACPDPNNRDDAYWFSGSHGPPAAAPRGRGTGSSELRTDLDTFSEGAELAADRAIYTVGSPGQKRARSRSRSRSRTRTIRARVDRAGSPVCVKEM